MSSEREQRLTAILEEVLLEPSDVDSSAYPADEVDGHQSRGTLVDLAYRKFLRERLLGRNIDRDAYCAQFPHLQHSLGQLIDAHLLAEEFAADGKSAVSPRVGGTFLGFQLTRELGTGSFATVYQATEPLLGNRAVVVKISTHGGAEAQILGRICHPNIVPIHSVRVDEPTGLTVVCMPYLGSGTLSQVLHWLGDSGPPREARAILDAVQDPDISESVASPAPAILKKGTYVEGVCHIGAQLADALAFIHELGICHRDLKPSNVLLMPSGCPMLLDFNLSADVEMSVPKPGGTLPYMSPEQLLALDSRQRDNALADPRSDVFSLGVILYQLLTAVHPFGPVPPKVRWRELRCQLLERQRQGQTPAHVLNAEVGRPLARLITQCLAYNPHDRPAAPALAAALRRQLSPWRRGRRWARRHPGSLLAAATAAMTIAMSAFLWSALQPPASVRELQTGLVCYQQREYRQAVVHLDRAVAAAPSGPAYFARGRAYQRLGEQDKRYWSLAVADFQAAERLAGTGRGRASLAYCLNRLEQTREAIYYYEQAIEAGLASAAVYGNLGYSFLKLRELDKCKESLDRAIRLNPGFQPAYHNRARLNLLKAQSYLPAGAPSRSHDERGFAVCVHAGIADARKAIALGPSSAALAYDAACLCALASRLDDRWQTRALEYLEEAVAAGCETRRLGRVADFQPLRNDPRFVNLCARKATTSPTSRPVLLVDPID